MITVSHAIFSSAVADDNSLSIRFCSIVGEIKYTSLGNGKLTISIPITDQEICIIALNHSIAGKSHIPLNINRTGKNRSIAGKNDLRPIGGNWNCIVQ